MQAFEYDEDGSKVFFFLSVVWAVVMTVITYLLWPRPENKGKKSNTKPCHCHACEIKWKHIDEKNASLTNRIRKPLAMVIIVIGWVAFIILTYKVYIIKTDNTEYDPYMILRIDKTASMEEIKKAYRKLSLEYHPDKASGDSEMFINISKAYAVFTDEESRANLEQYGNVDGPGAMSAGFALPKYIVKEEKSITLMFLVYTIVFIITMPICVGIWWDKAKKSFKIDDDNVLIDTVHLYKGVFQRNPNMGVKQIVKLLSAAFDFNQTTHANAVERLGDHLEVFKLMERYLGRKKEDGKIPTPLGKTRALLHAHLNRYTIKSQTLKQDQMYAVKKCLALINVMIDLLVSQVAVAMLYKKKKRDSKRKNKTIKRLHKEDAPKLPSLVTVEKCMDMAQMITQALESKACPLLQLPHFRLEMIRHFVTKKKHTTGIRDLVTMEENKRRDLLNNLNDDEYQDVINVCATMPNVAIETNVEVKGEDDKTIVANSIVTITVRLRRTNLIETYEQVNQSGFEQKEEDIEESETTTGRKSKKSWQKKRQRKHKTKTKHQKRTQELKTQPHKEESNKTQEVVQEHRESEDTESTTGIDNSTACDENNTDDDDTNWERFQKELPKETKKMPMETKKKESHNVHCPYFPEEKQEGWWLYVADRKNQMLVSAPVKIQSLMDKDERVLTMTAPRKIGLYTYSVVLRSDCYFGLDQINIIQLNVKEDEKAVNEEDKRDSTDESEAEKTSDHDSDYLSEPDDSESFDDFGDGDENND